MTKIPDDTKLAEAVAVTHLARLFDVHYLKTVQDEVDVAFREGDKLVGLGVKYNRAKGRVVRMGKVKEFYFISKDTLDDRTIPIPLFSAMLKVTIVRELEFFQS
ncbi:hypothetical protein [Sulfolobus acidocaldarius]|uniref:hypothetical protein n=1 Tax=Sulfolobus acidocaldarius TaxID=2285 RepID=UPI000A7DD7E2|nr:hypothetical protein [Sulfolobus acidocaldarius]